MLEESRGFVALPHAFSPLCLGDFHARNSNCNLEIYTPEYIVTLLSFPTVSLTIILELRTECTSGLFAITHGRRRPSPNNILIAPNGQ